MELKSARIRLAEDLSDYLTADPDKLGLKSDPDRIFLSSGLRPDEWQQKLLRSTAPRTVICCSRQVGKSTVVAAISLLEVLTKPNSLVLLLSGSLRQSGELLRDKVLKLYANLGSPFKSKTTQLSLHLSNGSRIESLPGDEGTIRGFSACSLVVIDEARTVAEDILPAVSPMLATSVSGRIIVLSTPLGRRGWFWNIWDSPPEDGWEKVSWTADQCPRISADFLAAEKRTMGESMFRQEYFCSFESMTGALLNYEDVMAMVSPTARPLFGIGA